MMSREDFVSEEDEDVVEDVEDVGQDEFTDRSPLQPIMMR